MDEMTKKFNELTEELKSMFVVSQAMAKNNFNSTLQQPAEFTEIFGKFLNYPDTSLNPRDPVQWQDMSFEACARLDKSEASRKELLKALKELSKVSWMIGNRITLAGSLPQQIDQIRVRAKAAIAKAE